MNRGCCNECGYKADYIIDNNNYADNGYKDLNQVPKDKMLCGVCYEENMANYKYVVWVGGCDDYYTSYKRAKKDYDKWIEQGYDDVHLDEVANG
jgi:hypothetical protein